MKKVYIQTCFEIIISLLFAYTAIEKFVHFSTFQIQFAKIPFVFATKTWFFSYFILLLEASIPILLLFDRFKKIGGWVSTILLSIFTSYLISKVIFNDNSECSCGGVFNSISIEHHIILNVVFLFLSIAIVNFNYQQQRVK